jgi:CheY-like chemotaxis protein/HPt (histidine-containing phosphotransfer) domain-containing protein
MSSDEQLNLFVEFEQVQKGIARQFGGTGLGLTISKKLIELMGGEISVHSKKGIGSEFYFNVPFGYERDQLLLKNKLKLNKLKVMVVDDSITAAEILRSYLSMHMSDITIVESGEEAVKEYLDAKCGYDLIFMDWKMPGLTGLEAAKIIINYDEANKTKIVLVTAYLRNQVMTGLMELKIESLLYKPVIPRKLCDILKTIYKIEADETCENIIEGVIQDTNIYNNESYRGKKLLVVEDNLLNQQVLYEILESRGFHVDLAKDGLEAVKMVKSQGADTYSLIIMDLHMPNMNGYEATKLIYSDAFYRKIPIIALTAEVLEDTETKVFQSGMKGYMTKPINAVELYETIESIINGQQIISEKDRIIDYKKVLDEKEGIMRLVNMEDVYYKILKKFRIEYEHIYEELLDCFEKKDYHEFEMKVHSLKGSAGNISANKIYLCVSLINDLVIKGAYEEVGLLLDEFKHELNELFSAIEYTLNLRENKETIEEHINNKEIKFESVEILFEELSNLFDQDFGRVEEKVKELRVIFANSKYHKKWEELEMSVEMFDVNRANRIIIDILELLRNE